MPGNAIADEDREALEAVLRSLLARRAEQPPPEVVQSARVCFRRAKVAPDAA